MILLIEKPFNKKCKFDKIKAVKKYIILTGIIKETIISITP